MGSAASTDSTTENNTMVVSEIQNPFFAQLASAIADNSLGDETVNAIRAISSDADAFFSSEVNDILKLELDPAQEGSWSAAAKKLMLLDPNLEEFRLKLVPGRMKESPFWNKYFNTVFHITANKSFSLASVKVGNNYEKERQVSIDAVIKACKVCEQVFKQLVTEDTLIKKDKSPVTVADFSAQAIVINEVRKAFPLIPVVGEEDSAALRANDALRNNVVNLTNSVYGDDAKLSEDEILSAIDYGLYKGGSKGRHFTLDPIDGTKGFLRGEQYAVCLALIEDGKPVLGVLGCPNLPTNWSERETNKDRGVILIGVKGQGATIRSIADPTETKIAVADISSIDQANFCESVEAAHSNHSDSAVIARNLGCKADPVRLDSQCKYAAIARGDAAIYLRLPTRKNYQEKIWDHAAGYLIVHEAGGRVTDTLGNELDFSIGRTLRDNLGVVASNGLFHDRVVQVVSDVLYNPSLKSTVTILASKKIKDQSKVTDLAPLQKLIAEYFDIDTRNVQIKLK